MSDPVPSRHDVGLTHVALCVTDIDASVAFYGRYAKMRVVHERDDPDAGTRVVWLSDGTRPFVIVLALAVDAEPVLLPFAHLGVGCASREEVDALCDQAFAEGALVQRPTDSGPPVGYWAFLKDPDGHTLELSFGQEVAFTVDEDADRA